MMMHNICWKTIKRFWITPVPLPLHTSICEDVFVVAPGRVGQIDRGPLEELGNEISSHTQGASARKRLDTCNAVLHTQMRAACLLDALVEMTVSAQVKMGHHLYKTGWYTSMADFC